MASTRLMPIHPAVWVVGSVFAFILALFGLTAYTYDPEAERRREKEEREKIVKVQDHLRSCACSGCEAADTILYYRRREANAPVPDFSD